MKLALVAFGIVVILAVGWFVFLPIAGFVFSIVVSLAVGWIIIPLIKLAVTTALIIWLYFKWPDVKEFFASRTGW
jgi:hypothetical protein